MAGEFFIVHEAGRFFMIVSNNSGSYKPDKDRLENTRQLFIDLLVDVDVEACLMDDPRIKQLTTRHRGDPLHMGHSIHHPELAEQRSAAQMKSALVIMGRGHEVGVYGYGQAPRQEFRAQSPHAIAGHRRSRTWGTEGGTLAALSGGIEEPSIQSQSSIKPADQKVGQYALGQNPRTNGYAYNAKPNSILQSPKPVVYHGQKGPVPFAHQIQNVHVSPQQMNMSARQMPMSGHPMSQIGRSTSRMATCR